MVGDCREKAVFVGRAAGKVRLVGAAYEAGRESNMEVTGNLGLVLALDSVGVLACRAGTWDCYRVASGLGSSYWGCSETLPFPLVQASGYSHTQ